MTNREAVSRYKVSSTTSSAVMPMRQRIIAVLVLVCGMWMAVPYNTYLALQEFGDREAVLDRSWQLELPARLGRGQLAGREFIFTYGPLYQLTHALGLVVPPGNLASIIRFHILPEVVITLLCVWLMLSYTRAPLLWRATAYLLWALLWTPISIPPLLVPPISGIKPMAGLFLVMSCGRVLAMAPSANNVTNHRRPSLGFAAPLIWALSGPVIILYVFDMGIMTLIALMLTASVVLICTASLSGEALTVRWRTLWAVAALFIGFIVFAITLSLFSGWNLYLSDSWQIAIGYMRKMMWPGSSQGFTLIAVVICIVCLILILTASFMRASWRAGTGEGQQPLILIAGTCFCLAWLRYSMTRSVPANFLLAIAPTLFVMGCFIPCYLRGISQHRIAWFAWVAAVPLILLSPLGWPHTVVNASVRRAAGIRKTQFRAAQLEIHGYGIPEAVAVAHSLPSAALYVWPYETIVNIAADKDNPAYTAHSYVAMTDELQQATVSRLKSIRELPVILFTEDWLIDSVEHLTRTPIIFRYLLENYELSGSPYKEFALLQRSAPGKRLWREQQLHLEPQKFVPGNGQKLIVNLSTDAADELRASDLLVMRLRAAKTSLFGIGKQGYQSVTFFLSSGERRTQRILLSPDGESSDVLISAATFSDPFFLSLFAPDRIWRSGERITSIKLEWTQMDALSVRPSEISLERIAVLKREGVEILETSLAEQSQPLFWNWCYKGVEQHPTVEGQAQISTSYVTTTYAHR